MGKPRMALAAAALVAAAFRGCGPAAAGQAETAGAKVAAEPQEVQIPTPALAPLEVPTWRLPPKYATLEGDRLVIDIPQSDCPADAVAEADLPASLFGGAAGFAMEVVAEGRGIRKPTKPYLGLKFQLHWRESATGREKWPNCHGRTGDFAAALLRNEADFSGAGPDTATLQLGLQGTAGRVEFDLSTLRAAPTRGLWRLVNQDYVVRYPDDDLPLRGCMLPGRPTTEDDIETLASWGATMARFQITRNWSANGDNQDLAEFAAWVDSRLDNLEDVLRWAGARGMKICVDLHVTPGGRDETREHAMFRDERFADAFVDTWRRIATRCARIVQTLGPVIYGYDLVNEPVQHGHAPIDYWTIQRRAAEAVREIDPLTPIVVESNDWDSPDAFVTLSPLAMDNVIYQFHCYAPHEFTHQGVAKRPREENGRPIAWPDTSKGWNREFLRRELAPVIDFQKRHGCRIYVGEFSAAAWAPGAENYLRDCIALFEEFGWDWTYHAFRESPVWDVEKVGSRIPDMVPAAEDTPRKKALLEGFRSH